MTRPAGRLRIVIHYLGKGLHAGRQAKQLEAAEKCSPELPASTL
jgi:hypothetical protein